MKLKLQKRLAAEVMKCSPKRVWFDNERLDEIKESITKVDIRSLIKDGAIGLIPVQGISRGRAKKRLMQKKKGRRKGFGSRKGKGTARQPKKAEWINKVRAQRGLIRSLKSKNLLSKPVYRTLYMKVKGGFFRSRRHIKLYIDENKLISKK